jgi:hypothetical protein
MYTHTHNVCTVAVTKMHIVVCLLPNGKLFTSELRLC